ncbi:energy transducer TonB [Solitalea lacus]|uniref:energy transducer TonB n=1 Tax=Solitalea lacus TaxID=2911172 RepID=UPI001EDC0226|nr:energy transducer TonB [Solitalea lacus]UKJ06408.1 energy transducer TonB [Solitalea lacus]
MKNLFTNTHDLTEIVFENRNREYGAYQLRARYDKTMRKALFSSVGSLVILGVITVSLHSKADEGPKVISIPYVIDTRKYEIVPDKPLEPELPKKTASLPPAATVKSTELTVVPDEKVAKPEHPPTKEELEGKAIGSISSENTGAGNTENMMPGNEGESLNGTENGNSTAETPFVHAEEMPEYEGGFQKMFKFIGRNLRYPNMAVENDIEGAVTVQFVVDKDGNVYNASVLKGIGGGCDEEAVRVVKLLKFKPGRQNGQPVKVQFSLPIRFTLNK